VLSKRERLALVFQWIEKEKYLNSLSMKRKQLMF